MAAVVGRGARGLAAVLCCAARAASGWVLSMSSVQQTAQWCRVCLCRHHAAAAALSEVPADQFRHGGEGGLGADTSRRYARHPSCGHFPFDCPVSRSLKMLPLC